MSTATATATTLDTASTVSVSNNNTNTNTNKKRSRAKAIAQLQAEIAELDNELEEANAKKKIATHTSASKIVNYLLNADLSTSTLSGSDYLQSIDQLDLLDDENHLAAITTNDVVSSLVYLEDSNEIRRRYTIKGTSTAVPFTLVFDVDEARKCIGTINVTVQDSIRHEIEPLIKSLDQSLSVVSFLQNFNKYTELRQYRHNVFTELVESYPESISLPCGAYSSVLSVYARAQPKFSFKVEWNFTFSGSSSTRVSQSIQMFPKTSDEALSRDLEKQFANIPTITSRFRQLVQTKGPKAAIQLTLARYLRH